MNVFVTTCQVSTATTLPQQPVVRHNGALPKLYKEVDGRTLSNFGPQPSSPTLPPPPYPVTSCMLFFLHGHLQWPASNRPC